MYNFEVRIPHLVDFCCKKRNKENFLKPYLYESDWKLVRKNTSEEIMLQLWFTGSEKHQHFNSHLQKLQQHFKIDHHKTVDIMQN